MIVTILRKSLFIFVCF